MADFSAHHLACGFHFKIDSTILLRDFLSMSKHYDILVRITVLLNSSKDFTHEVTYLFGRQLCYPRSFLSPSSIPFCIIGIVRRTFSSYIIGVGYSWEDYILKKSFTSYALHCAVLLSTAFSTVLSTYILFRNITSHNYCNLIWLVKPQIIIEVCKSLHRFYPIIFTQITPSRDTTLSQPPFNAFSM